MAALIRKILIFPMVFSLLSMPLASTAMAAAAETYVDEELRAGAMAADILVVRPIGIVATVLGTALFVIASPFAALGGNIPQAFDHLMAKPAKFTFARPLGDFD